jgi:hypothetical protein
MKKSSKRLVLSSETLRCLSGSWVKGGAGAAILDSDGACPPSEPDNTCYWGCSAGSCAGDACGQG